MIRRSTVAVAVVAAATLTAVPAAVLSKGSGEPAPGDPAGFAGDAERGRADYEKLCAPCHGAEGKGDGHMTAYLDATVRDMTDTPYMSTRTDEQLFIAIQQGGAEVGLSDKMAPWGHMLSDGQIRDLVAFVRTFSQKPEAP